jgi:hypothetical protein
MVFSLKFKLNIIERYYLRKIEEDTTVLCILLHPSQIEWNSWLLCTIRTYCFDHIFLLINRDGFRHYIMVWPNIKETMNQIILKIRNNIVKCNTYIIEINKFWFIFCLSFSVYIIWMFMIPIKWWSSKFYPYLILINLSLENYPALNFGHYYSALNFDHYY